MWAGFWLLNFRNDTIRKKVDVLVNKSAASLFPISLLLWFRNYVVASCVIYYPFFGVFYSLVYPSVPKQYIKLLDVKNNKI